MAFWQRARPDKKAGWQNERADRINSTVSRHIRKKQPPPVVWLTHFASNLLRHHHTLVIFSLTYVPRIDGRLISHCSAKENVAGATTRRINDTTGGKKCMIQHIHDAKGKISSTSNGRPLLQPFRVYVSIFFFDKFTQHLSRSRLKKNPQETVTDNNHAISRKDKTMLIEYQTSLGRALQRNKRNLIKTTR
jgi:hypothetical protein